MNDRVLEHVNKDRFVETCGLGSRTIVVLAYLYVLPNFFVWVIGLIVVSGIIAMQADVGVNWELRFLVVIMVILTSVFLTQKFLISQILISTKTVLDSSEDLLEFTGRLFRGGRLVWGIILLAICMIVLDLAIYLFGLFSLFFGIVGIPPWDWLFNLSEMMRENYGVLAIMGVVLILQLVLGAFFLKSKTMFTRLRRKYFYE